MVLLSMALKFPGFQELQNGDLINLGKYSVLFERLEKQIATPAKSEQPVAATQGQAITAPSVTPELDNLTGTATAYDPNFVVSQDELLVKQALQWVGLGAGANTSGRATHLLNLMRVRPVSASTTIHDQRYLQSHHFFHRLLDQSLHSTRFLLRNFENQFIMYL